MSSYKFDANPVIPVETEHHPGVVGIDRIAAAIAGHHDGSVAIECYHGVDIDSLKAAMEASGDFQVIDTRDLMKPEAEIRTMIFPDVTDDLLFGYITRLRINDYFPEQIELPTRKTARRLVVGPGALYVKPDAETRVYADMPRWEIQLRQRQGLVDGLGLRNRDDGAKALYKQAFFVDWRVLDHHKRDVFRNCDFYLDTTAGDRPKMVRMPDMLEAMKSVSGRPFELKPFFDPGVWGGHWMQEKLGIEGEVPNYAWCFNCVPEENSMLLGFGEEVIESPSINLVFFETESLMGCPVYARFGDEFPIRFDFLDTMGGQNLSFQVHPRTEYIQKKFGMNYTQDESYYILDAGSEAFVYLGLKEGSDPEAMKRNLAEAQEGRVDFDDGQFVQTWPASRHDHFLIPAGTVHCSGSDSMVLEISATPYIFTFKLWDWGRVDLDGNPRPINLDHGFANIDFRRTTGWVGRNLVNRVEEIGEGPGWTAERTGLHESEFIETVRHWFTGPVVHDTGGVETGSVHVLNLVEGEEVIVESPIGAFRPFPVHYAETFVVPAAVGQYVIRPSDASSGQKCATVRASIRQESAHV